MNQRSAFQTDSAKIAGLWRHAGGRRPSGSVQRQAMKFGCLVEFTFAIRIARVGFAHGSGVGHTNCAVVLGTSSNTFTAGTVSGARHATFRVWCAGQV